jgi:hypothetical protein
VFFQCRFIRTMLRFVIEGDKIKDLEIIEIEKA